MLSEGGWDSPTLATCAQLISQQPIAEIIVPFSQNMC